MEQQVVEVRFQGQEVGSYDDSAATYTLYQVPGGLYVVHVDQGEEAWLETGGGRGLEGQQVGTFFPELAETAGLED